MVNPKRVRAGQIGMQKRWAAHVPMTLRLQGLTEGQRLAVVEMVRYLRATNIEGSGKDA